MTTITLKQAENYLLHITALPVEAVKDCIFLHVESQWLDAKAPHERQSKFGTTITPAQAEQLAELFTRASLG